MTTFGAVQITAKPASDAVRASNRAVETTGLWKSQANQVSSFALLRHAVEQLQNLAMRETSLIHDVSSMRTLLALVLTDGVPTPQVGLTGDSQIEVRWLVGDDFLTITALGDGDFLAMHFINDELHDSIDFDTNAFTRSSRVVTFLNTTLVRMASGVEERIPLNL